MIPITLTDLHMYLLGCDCSEKLLTSGKEVVELLRELVERSGLEPLKTQFHDFGAGGTTAVVLLAESHVAIHTWPETNRLVVADISVCNYTADNRQKTHLLKDLLIKAFKPSDKVIHEVDPTPRIQEYNCPGMAYFAEIDLFIEKKRTQFQDVILFQNRTMGKVLVLDGLFQTSEKDEFFYHEAIVHPAMLSHDDPRSVLILGGGDLGAAEEVLKYPSVERVLQIDIDREVVELCMAQLSAIHKDCYKDRRFEVSFEDGFEYMKRDGETFDVLILDLTDPVGVCERLYTEEFYSNVLIHRMKSNSLVTLHQGFPFTLPERSQRIHGALRQVFSEVKSYSNYVPLYGDTMLYALCGNEVNLVTQDEAERRIESYGLRELQFISGECYQGIFGLPLYIRRLLDVG